jgi:hypothetical protein
MSRTFGIVDEAVIQAAYFLERVDEEGDILAIRANVVAFSSACRSITYALQASLADNAVFKIWYTSRRRQLSESNLAKYFHAFRRITHHIGENSINYGFKTEHLFDLTNGKNKWFFGEHPDFPKPPSVDVPTACRQYFKELLLIVFDCYDDFRFEVNAQWYFTAENFSKMSLTIEDAEEQLGFARKWTKVGPPFDDTDRWKALGRTIGGCGIDDIFDRWLGRIPAHPDNPKCKGA